MGAVKFNRDRSYFAHQQARRLGYIAEVRIKDRGVFDADAMQDGLRSIVSQVPQSALLDGLNQAVRFCQRNGAPVKQFALKRV